MPNCHKATDLRILKAIAITNDAGYGVTVNQIVRATGAANSTIYRSIHRLIEAGRLMVRDNSREVHPNAKQYSATVKGLIYLDEIISRDSPKTLGQVDNFLYGVKPLQ